MSGRSSTAYVALYPTDFLADVGHLGNTELGIYWRLLLVYYRDGRPLPFDADKLRRLAMTFSPEECRALDSVVAEFFLLTTEPDGSRVWRHRRADAELAIARDKHAAAVEKAQRAAEARWSKRPAQQQERADVRAKDAPKHRGDATSIASSMPQAMLALCQPEPEPEPTASLREAVGDVAHSATPPTATRSRRKRSEGADAPAPDAAPPAFDGLNGAAIHEHAIVPLARQFELGAEWGQDALALGWDRNSILREAERFRQYWTVGKGKGKRRSVRGWRQAWSNWLARAERMAA